VSRTGGFTSERSLAVAADDSSARMVVGGDESRAFVIRFTKLLPGWLRRCGVRRSDLDDAVQEAAVEVLEKIGSRVEAEGLTETQARHELMRIVSNVALRVRRRLQRESDRYSSVEANEALSSRDEEAWVEARALVLTAIGNLDEPTRALIFAHEVEGRTNIEIAAGLRLKEDAVEKRVHLAKQRLRGEVEHLERGRLKMRVRAAVGCFGMFWQSSDPVDKALMGALHEALGQVPRFSGRTRDLRSVRPNMPTTALMGALVLAPMVPTTPVGAAVPAVKQISNLEWPHISIAMHVPTISKDVQDSGTTKPEAKGAETNAHNVVRASEAKKNLKTSDHRGSREASKPPIVQVPDSLVVSELPESRD